MRLRQAFAAAALTTVGLVGISGCRSDADVASQNISTAADNFEIERRIVFYNGITNDYIMTIQGRCSVTVDRGENKLDVICKTGPNEYIKDFFGMANNVTWFAEQLRGADVSTYNLSIVFKPQSIVPDIIVKGDAEDLARSVQQRQGVQQQSAAPH